MEMEIVFTVLRCCCCCCCCCRCSRRAVVVEQAQQSLGVEPGLTHGAQAATEDLDVDVAHCEVFLAFQEGRHGATGCVVLVRRG